MNPLLRVAISTAGECIVYAVLPTLALMAIRFYLIKLGKLKTINFIFCYFVMFSFLYLLSMGLSFPPKEYLTMNSYIYWKLSVAGIAFGLIAGIIEHVKNVTK